MQKSSSSRLPIVAALTVLGGLFTWSHLSAPTTPVTVIAGVDASRSVRIPTAGGGTLLGSSRASLTQLATRLHPGLDRLVVSRVDRQTKEFFDEDAPAGSEGFLQTLLDHTQNPPTVDGTFPAKFWTLAAKRAASMRQAPGVAVAVVFAGDGDNDDFSPNAQNAMRAVARALAANKRVVSVEFFGVDPKNWATIRELFAPLGERLRLHPPQQMEPDELVARLEAARRVADALHP